MMNEETTSMSKPSTQIKNIVVSHLRGALFGIPTKGMHEIATHDSITAIECYGASRFERYGTATVYHPELGKWRVSLDASGQHVRGTPVQAMTADAIRAALAAQESLEVLYRVYKVQHLDA